ncbi:MAG TPA: phosphoribosylglycinamide formyltransferase [Rhodanobacteraceae bacterium]|nr:phosphoribosylglycinamide formyltransferase [Rhodanobacteraceae bacterium]
MTSALPVAVLVSGRGSNLEALIHAREAGSLPVEFALVASDKTDAPALRMAESHGIATLALDPRGYDHRRAYDMDLFERIAASGAQLVVLAGFMRIIDADAVTPWHGRMINIHPSLLPKYRGLHTHRKALAAGDREHGASVHFVTAELDGGPVIAQAVIDIRADDTEDQLAARLLAFEHQLLPATLALIAQQRVCLDTQGVMFDGQPLQAPLRLVDGRLTTA